MAGRGDLPPSGFGAKLRAMRDAKGWTQKEMADAAGLHPNTVARLERGEHEPTWPLVLKFAQALGVDCTAFTGGEPDPPPKGGESTSKKPKK